MTKLNYELLKDLYCIHSKSGSEKRMRRFIKKWIKNNVPEAGVTQDQTGNLYITKGDAGSYPCLCAHMDQVQDFHPLDFMCVETDEVIFGYSPKMRKQCGLGADDKNGLFVALSCLQEYDILKCAFFVGEEIGCVGSGKADMEFFKDCRFCVQIDRRDNGDMVTSISGQICSDDFIKAARAEEYGYAPSDGLMTDVEALHENGVGISCINLSCGYYAPHTDEEFTSKPDLEKCHAFVCHLIEDCTDTYPFEFVLATKYNYWGALSSEDRLYDLLDYFIPECPEVTFDEFYEDYGVSYPSVTEKRQKQIFTEMKAYHSFGN